MQKRLPLFHTEQQMPLYLAETAFHHRGEVQHGVFQGPHNSIKGAVLAVLPGDMNTKFGEQIFETDF